MKEVIHESLEGGRGIGKMEEHYSWFEESFMSDESSIPLVSILNSDIVVSPLNVKFGEDFCPLEFINEVGNEWKGVCIMDCVFVNIAVILTRAEVTILLFNKEEGRCLWGIGGVDLVMRSIQERLDTELSYMGDTH